MVNMWGAVGDLKIIDREEKIPVLSIHGTADDVVPYDYDHPFRGSLGINRLHHGQDVWLETHPRLAACPRDP
ncbi:MAG: hypothetical protein MZV63_58205 [Marinilabiliales bacterium]|nr:hypothetical protein [Marinilabiliales bacterium]